MKIIDSQVSAGTRAHTHAPTSVEGGDASTGRASTSRANSDCVMLSDLTRLIAVVSGEVPASNSEHVARVASQYRNGTYVVDDTALAAALVDRALEGLF
jgi:anti-sigma28 factor (negative regulator of flagellin synthesis)